MSAVISVVIPVGPAPHHSRWLGECLRSVGEQVRAADSILLVDDMQGLGYEAHPLDVPPSADFPVVRVQRVQAGAEWWDAPPLLPTYIYRPPWLLGVTGAFNAGVALALSESDLAVMLGSDDRLEPRALAALEERYEGNRRRDGYYWFDVLYENGTEQGLACNNAAVTPGFMRQTGGLPVDASSGAMDAALISALMTHRPEFLVRVAGGVGARFWSRQHAQQETGRMNRYGAANAIIRDVFTTHFEAPRWGRYE